MITPAFSLTATERVLPNLALDFTTASLDSRVTFTRAGNTATRVNSSGYVELINADLPRFDYNPVTLVCKGLLIEESRSNLSIQSQDFTTWTGGANVTADQDVSPDGTTNADELNGQIFRTIAASAVQYTFSVFAKAKATNDTLELRFDNTITLRRAFFNLTTGTVTSSSNATAVSENYGNGWYRCSIVVTATATTFYQVINRSSATSFYIWGAQLETGAFATSYIPTTTSQVTRSADVATMTGTNFSDWYNATEGTAQSEFIFSTEPGYASGGSSQRVFEFSDGTTNNRWLMYRNESVSDQMYYLNASGGSLVVNTTVNATNTTSNTIYKAAMAAKNSSFAAAFNGNTPAMFGSGSIAASVNQLFLGKALSNGFLNGWLRKFNYYPQRLTNAEVQAISK